MLQRFEDATIQDGYQTRTEHLWKDCSLHVTIFFNKIVKTVYGKCVCDRMSLTFHFVTTNS